MKKTKKNGTDVRMAKTSGFRKRKSDVFVIHNAMRYWRNIAVNLDGKIDDREFFEFLEDHDSARLAMRMIEKRFTRDELDVASYGDVNKFFRKSETEAMYELWNDKLCQERCRDLAVEVADRFLGELGDLGGSETSARIGSVAELFALDGAEKEILAFAYVFDVSGMVFPERVYGGSDKSKMMSYIAMATDMPVEYVRTALTPKGRLRRYNCINDEYGIVQSPIGDFIAGANEEGLEGSFYSKSAEPTLPWRYFGEIAEHSGALLKRLLDASKSEGGMNILLYGAPGTGKTSFARSLVAEAGLDAYEIRQNERDGCRSDISSSSRIVGIQVCNDRIPAGKGVIIIDEADEILRTNAFGFSRLFGDIDAHGSEKGVVNSLLDEMKIPAIWIVNTPSEAMDPSVRRRFDYSVRFRSLSRRQRETIWRNNVEKYGLEKLINDSLVREFASRYETSAGGIALVARNVAKLRPRKEDVRTLMTDLIKPHCELVGIESARRGDLPVDNYSLDGLNIKNAVPLERIADVVKGFYASNSKGLDLSRPRVNILLWGPPGTGKTEFAKYVAARGRRKLRVKMGSDLLSCWVGGTEKLIADAFREAEEDGAILFMDEIDGMVQSRGRAVRGWEVTQVNELLHCMENFDGVFIGATNYFDNLDEAIMRRFTFKLQFDFLDDKGKVILFERIFGATLSASEREALCRLDNVTPGDMATVRQNLYYLGGETGNTERIAAMSHEIGAKRLYRPHAIGFGA